MGFFDEFKKKRAERWRAEEKAAKKPWEKALSIPFDFPYEVLKRPTPKKMLSAWKDASRTDGVPIIIVWDDQMQYMWYNPTALSQNVDLDEQFAEAIDELLHGEEGQYYLGEPSDQCAPLTSLAPLLHGEVIVCLACVPVEEPWQILRRIPFGGWNECPDASVAEAFLKRLYDDYGAAPVAIRSDTLELIPRRKPRGDEAFELAKQMYAFCPDCVMQGAGSVRALAHCLEHSDVWHFWWD